MMFDKIIDQFLSKYNLSFVLERNNYYIHALNLNIENLGDNFVFYSTLFAINENQDSILNNIAFLQSTRLKKDKTSLFIDKNNNLALNAILPCYNVSIFLFERFIEQFLDAKDFWLNYGKSCM